MVYFLYSLREKSSQKFNFLKEIYKAEFTNNDYDRNNIYLLMI